MAKKTKLNPWLDAVYPAINSPYKIGDFWLGRALEVHALKTGQTLTSSVIYGRETSLDYKKIRKIFENFGGKVVETNADWHSRDYLVGTGPQKHSISFNMIFGDKGAVHVECSPASLGSKKHKTNFDFYCFDNALLNKFYNFITENLTETQSVGYVWFMVGGTGGIRYRAIESAPIPLIRDNYTLPVLEAYDRMVDELKRPNPKGRLHIINGPPGSGKSFALNGLVTECDSPMFIIIQADVISQLAGPSIVDSLIDLKAKERPIVFIVEDADLILNKRDAGTISGVSSLLNFGDGFLGRLIDTRIVATTNAKLTEFDDAIVRPGRLSTHVTIDALDKDHAARVYSRLTSGGTNPLLKTKSKFTLAEIYSMAGDAGFKPAGTSKSDRPMGFAMMNQRVEKDGDIYDLEGI